MAENLLRSDWSSLDQADLRLLLEAPIGGPGQHDGEHRVLYLPFAHEKCQVSLRYEGTKIVAIEPGAAFDRAMWSRLSEEIESDILVGPTKVGREFSFSALYIKGWWRGEQSGVQILPPPDDAPRPTIELADHPFVLEFPVQDTGVWPITNHRRIREHRRLTLVLNVLLAGAITRLPDRPRHFWACVRRNDTSEFHWAQEFYSARLGKPVTAELSPPTGNKLEEVAHGNYFDNVGHDGLGLRVPDDLDDLICRYKGLSSLARSKFERAAYWFGMASRQWDESISASFASLVTAAEALTENSIKHTVYCADCAMERTHDVPGATERFRAIFERYAPDPGLRERRSKMYALRSKILHGSDLMLLDENRAFGWDPPGWSEREMHSELWGLLQIVLRNWLKNPPAE